jgi:glycosyltransferase involved in cell wall biosynthesis
MKAVPGARKGEGDGPLRIGLVTPAWPGTKTANGIATAVMHLATGLEACGHEVTILAHRIDAPDDRPRVILLPSIRMDLIDRFRMRFNPAVAGGISFAKLHVAAIQEAQRKYGLEIVLMEETHGWAGEVRKRASVPVVATLHGPWWLHRISGEAGDEAGSARREALEAEGLRRVDGITSPSRDVMERTEAVWGLPDIPRAVIRNPVPLPADALPADAGLLNSILFVGRFDRIKGGDLVIAAFARIAAANQQCRLTFAGPDVGIARPDGSQMTLADTLAGLPDDLRARIDATGPRTRDEVTALRRSHGITLIASRYETFGGTLAEAMAAGSAVVCTKVGGCQENVVHESTGLLVPPEDPEALADACLRLMADPALARRLGQAARRFAAEELAPEVIGRQMAAFLAPLCRR